MLLAVPHGPALLPNTPHPKSTRFPLHLPVSTCRAPTATPTPWEGPLQPLSSRRGAAGAGGAPAGQGARNPPAAPSGPGHGRAEGLPPPTLLLREGWTTAEGPLAALQRQAGPTLEELRPQAHGTVGNYSCSSRHRGATHASHRQTSVNLVKDCFRQHNRAFKLPEPPGFRRLLFLVHLSIITTTHRLGPSTINLPAAHTAAYLRALNTVIPHWLQQSSTHDLSVACQSPHNIHSWCNTT